MNTLIDTQDRLSVLASTPLMQRRVEITTAIKSGAINPQWMNDFVQRLGNTPTHADAWTQAQSLLNGNTGTISLATPEEQLIWAGALAIEQAGTNQNHSIYKAIIDHADIRREKQAAAHLIDRSLSNSSISVSWGMPGSWFWFDPEQQHVNLDPMYALITRGFK